ncbi:MAG: DNA internalization-related competence protein ComEC/Rec2, partial [Lactobacillaceae bacterium]|nr:DNA internalization-related competence protein ComEC/Rec2 [Lactobacillaceae bacterium]
YNTFTADSFSNIRPAGNFIIDIRKRIIDPIKNFPDPLKNYASALLIGKVDQGFYDDNPAITKLNLIHLFSISGFQVTYLSTLLKKTNIRLRVPKQINDYLNISILPIFFFISGSPSSLLRPIIASETRLFTNRFNKLEVWSISLLAALIISPQVLFTLGGQLSFLLSFGLVIASRFNYFNQTIFMTILSLPILLNAKFTFHFLSILSNLLAIPLFSILIIPLIAASIVLRSIDFVPETVNSVLKILNYILETISSLPGEIVFGKLPNFLALLLIISVIGISSKKYRKRLIQVTSILLGGSFLFIHIPISGEFTMFDIGQGDSFLYRQPFNKTVNLIDTGGLVQFAEEKWRKKKYSQNQIDSITLSYLHANGISKIDNLVLTHKDTDHIGNVKYLLPHIKVQNILIPNGMESTKTFREEIRPFVNQKTKILSVDIHSTLYFPFQILNPRTEGKAENEDSIALFFKAGKTNIFTAGDLGKKGEMEILTTFPKMKIDLLKVGHHGSKTSNDSRFVQQSTPKYAFISAGRNNHYGHPNQQTIKTLNRYHVKLFNTQINGMTKLTYNFMQTSFKTYLHENQ